MSRDFEGGTTGDEAAAASGLSDLAGSVEIGAVPYDSLVAGGRRRLRRRRLLTAGAAVALVAAVAGGGTALAGYGRDGGTTTVAAASAGTAAPSTTPTAGPTPVATPTATPTPTAPVRDPFTPIRVKLGEGTANGHTWQAWAALWPAAPTKEDAHRQAQLMWEDRHAAIPQLPRSTDAEVDRGWRPDKDEVNLYLTLDGKRQVDDSTHQTDVPGTPGDEDAPGAVTSVAGTMLGLKGAEMGDSPVVIQGVTPKVAKVVVTWRSGGTTEAVPATVGGSRTRWVAIAKKPGSEAKSFVYYGADGEVLGTDSGWFRSS
ncbi:hypothetical protein [Kitasatospora sp. SUK 42]|uniref:hypothetical protein n=1 Tax=Kitasatospora sp. SUK 42 TaxID=1588882 RepID=UPI0018C93A7D|nr:hypothetical protein [Kitasatospora sp. SUK 42]MBV2152653.1 hypothetical protein [Kitasatospora sp. SUK 42]